MVLVAALMNVYNKKPESAKEPKAGEEKVPELEAK